MKGRADHHSAQEITDRIYEAVFVPELWEGLFEYLSAQTGSASGSMLLFGQSGPPSFIATALVRPNMMRFFGGDEWRGIIRNDVARNLEWQGFRCDVDFMSLEQIQRDPVDRQLRLLGLSWQLGSYAVLPTGETTVFTFERFIADGRHTRVAVGLLDRLRPHLVRASMLAIKLGLEQARAMVDAMDALGMPAAALRRNGSVLAMNPAFGALAPAIRPGAFGSITLAQKRAETLFKAALAAVDLRRTSTVLSIPIAAIDEQPASVAHLIPVRREVFYALGGARWLMVVTRAGGRSDNVDQTMIRALFDLTPAEAQLAVALTRNIRLSDYEAATGLSLNTVKTHLKRLFDKTGVHRQSELIRLLSGLSIS